MTYADLARPVEPPHPDYARLVAEHRDQAAPVLAALEATGWTSVLLDPCIDSEAPELPTAVEVVADAPVDEAGLGRVRVRARVVTGRPATSTDLHLLIGGMHINPGTALGVLVADELDAAVAAALPQCPMVARVGTAAIGLR